MTNEDGIPQKRLLLWWTSILIFLPIASAGQIIETPVPTGSRSKSLGASYSTLTDFWSSLQNPSNLALQENKYQAGFYYENSYLAKELNLTGIGASYSSSFLNIGAYLSRYGISTYNKGNAAISIGKKVFKQISIGAKISYHYIQASDGYGSVGAVTGEVGVNSKITKWFNVGIHIINPTNQSIGNEIKEPLPSALVLGFSYSSPWNITIYSDLDKFSGKKIGIHTGFEWNIMSNLHARTGYRSQPNVLSFGIGYSTSFLAFDLSITKHETLGYSPQVAATFWFDP